MKKLKQVFSVLICVALCLPLLSCSISSRSIRFSTGSDGLSSGSMWSIPSLNDPLIVGRYRIGNPYEFVDWETYGQYKADFHAHSTISDGKNTVAEMLERYYSAGFSIVAITDHNYLTKSWDQVDTGAISKERAVEMASGKDRNGLGMIGMTNSIEQSRAEHINSFFAEYNNPPNAKISNTLAAVEAFGGITFLDHVGRYTGGLVGGSVGADASNDPLMIQKYVDMFNDHGSCVGMEIVNSLDNESRSDRILWDNILSRTMPDGRFVWGFANGDSHGIDRIGYSFNIMLMPSLSLEGTRLAMERGTFYAVSRVSRPDGINSTLPNGDDMPGSGTNKTLYLLEQPMPGITGIVVDQWNCSITIAGTDYDRIEWIADGVVIATGERLDLNKYHEDIGCYVRAQLKSRTGIAYTQPFSIKKLVPSVGKTAAGEQYQTIMSPLSEYQAAVLRKTLKGTVHLFSQCRFC